MLWSSLIELNHRPIRLLKEVVLPLLVDRLVREHDTLVASRPNSALLNENAIFGDYLDTIHGKDEVHVAFAAQAHILHALTKFVELALDVRFCLAKFLLDFVDFFALVFDHEPSLLLHELHGCDIFKRC